MSVCISSVYFDFKFLILFLFYKSCCLHFFFVLVQFFLCLILNNHNTTNEIPYIIMGTNIADFTSREMYIMNDLK